MLHGGVVVGLLYGWKDGMMEGMKEQYRNHTTTHNGSGTTTTITRFEKPEPIFLFTEECMQMICL